MWKERDSCCLFLNKVNQKRNLRFVYWEDGEKRKKRYCMGVLAGVLFVIFYQRR